MAFEETLPQLRRRIEDYEQLLAMMEERDDGIGCCIRQALTQSLADARRRLRFIEREETTATGSPRAPHER